MTIAKIDLAHRINAAHEACSAAMRSGLAHAIEAGMFLIEAKAIIGHGDWLDWVRANCSFSHRLSQQYIQAARNREWLDSNAPRVAHLSFRGAMDLIRKTKVAVKSLPPARQAAILEHCESLADIRREAVASAILPITVIATPTERVPTDTERDRIKAAVIQQDWYRRESAAISKASDDLEKLEHQYLDLEAHIGRLESGLADKLERTVREEIKRQKPRF